VKTDKTWAWVRVWGVVGLAASFESELVDLLGEGRAGSSYFFLGVGLGWEWYRLHPRALAERLAGPALLACAVAVVLLGGGSADGGPVSPKDLTAAVVLVGLVLTERWRAEQRTALTSRDTMRDLH
jgi:hypothetical protein